jgi:hypothetical protein
VITAIDLALLGHDADHHRKAYLNASRRRWTGADQLRDVSRAASIRLRSAAETVLTLASAGRDADRRTVELATLALVEHEAGIAYQKARRRGGVPLAEFSALVDAGHAFREAVARVFAENEALTSSKGGPA